MKTTLDQSHRTVLANFDAFQRAQQCANEIKEYIWDVLREVEAELPATSDPPMKFVLDKGGWLQANTFANWGRSGFDLVSIGVENFDAAELIGADGVQGCRAFIYSILLSDPKRASQYTDIVARLRALEPPKGFAPATTNMHGYIFVKRLGALSADSLCSRSNLKSYFADPLRELAAWFEHNHVTIAAFPKTSRKTR